MQLPRPYLYTSKRTVALVDRHYMRPVEGPIADSVYGYHTLWAAEVPFIPAYVGKGDGDFDSEAANRLTRVFQRQVRFLYDLAQSKDFLTTFEMRFVAWPQPGGLGRVGIAFLGKTFHPDERISSQQALGLWNKFSAVFPREDPFSYPLVPVRHFDDMQKKETRSFKEWFEPIPFEQLNRPQSIVELRKYEDWPTIRDVGGVLHVRDYIPHPFVAALDYSALARLLETLARQQQVSMVAITLRPQQLTDQEVVILHELAGWYQRAARGEVTIENPLIDVLKELKSDIFESYTRSRAELGQKVYNNLVHEHRSVFLARLQVIGTPFAQEDLVEALGSEIMANAGSAYPSRWVAVEPDPDELRWARFNLQWLEFARWGISHLIQQDRRIVRLRYLATVSEAAGAFRLPVASATGRLAGLDVRDEPFSPGNTSVPGNQAGIELGALLDRGIETDMSSLLPLNALSGVVQVLGEQSQTRVRVLQRLLEGLCALDVPWVFICKGESVAYQGIEQLAACSIAVDETKDMSRWHELGVQPFLPPPGVPLMKFLDALLRVFIAVCELDGATSVLLRQALMHIYKDAGWSGQERGRMIDMQALAAYIEEMARQPSTPAEIAATLRMRCVLSLKDLAATATHVLNVPPGQTLVLSDPLLISVGWLGSDLSNALVRGCLWMWYMLACGSLPVREQLPRGVVTVEEPHTLASSVAPSTGLASLFTLLSNEGINERVGTLLIDERPDLLSVEITNKAAATLLTHGANLVAQEHIAGFIGASQRQRARMAQLRSSEAILSIRGTTPVLVAL